MAICFIFVQNKNQPANKMKKNKQLILSLIKDDLTNTQLINGLNSLGLDAGNYYLNLSNAFFSLMGFGNYNQNTALYEEYFDVAEMATTQKLLETPEELNTIALAVYDKLMLEKQRKKLKK